MSATRDLECKSSACTLSDMEVFIFPELLYALVLANILSPRLWRWRDDPWFAGLQKMKPSRRIARLKQYVIDHYIFNLDLDTWGLTTKERELDRFSGFVSREALAQSNALFGYEGDKYYFDIDIRTHFGLHKYEGNVIPYWKTETVEAMDAFRHKPDYGTGAGECVSLAALYAAALFLVARIPLRDIYLMATPLHSQNFVDVDDGILTNNRRLVTKPMWFNGTALSAQARRALDNERVTAVAHESGYVHTLYPEATLDPAMYEHFSNRLRAFLNIPLSVEVLGSFLRHHRAFQSCFQLRHSVHGSDRYVPLERMFEYEGDTSYLVTNHTREKLLAGMDMAEFAMAPLPGRMVLNDLETFVREQPLDIHNPEHLAQLEERFPCDCLNSRMAIGSLVRFCHTEPRLPDPAARRFLPPREPLGITVDMTREQILARLESLRGSDPTADLAFYAYRDLNRTPADPFVWAAIQRNPVSVEATRAMDLAAVETVIRNLPDESIYDEDGRLAQPDEVWNFGRGDGAEKALLLANVLRSRRPGEAICVEIHGDAAVLTAPGFRAEFASSKRLRTQQWQIPQR